MINYDLSRSNNPDIYTRERLDAKLGLVQGLLESKDMWAKSISAHYVRAGRFPSRADKPEINALGEASTPFEIDETEFGFPYLQVIKWSNRVSYPFQQDQYFDDYDFRGIQSSEQIRPSYHPQTPGEELLLVRDLGALWIGQKLVQPEVAFDQLDHLIRRAIVPAVS